MFHVLMQERHVTRAAVRLHLTQGAVSAALGRMRTMFGDELFVRTRGEMNPTSRAYELSAPISKALGSLVDILDIDEGFDPATSTRTFHVAMSDDLETIIAPLLIQKSVAENWRAKFSFHQSNAHLLHEHLSNESIDLLVAPMPTELSGEYRAQQIMSGSYLSLYSVRQFDFGDAITYEQYLNVDHLRVSFDAQRGFIDDLLESAGESRRVPVSLSHFAGILPVLHKAPVIATIPDHAARAYTLVSEDLRVTIPPIVVPTYAVSAVWRVTTEGDAAHTWLRRTIASLVASYLPHDR